MEGFSRVDSAYRKQNDPAGTKKIGPSAVTMFCITQLLALACASLEISTASLSLEPQPCVDYSSIILMKIQ